MLKKSIMYLVVIIFISNTFLYAIAPNTVVATINVGVTPSNLAITPDSRFAYVANNNNYGVGGYTVSVLDLTTNLPIQTISDPSFNEPYTVTINSSGTRAYVTNSNGATITIIDITTNTVIGLIGGFDGPSGMVITPDGNFAYVNNYGGPLGVGSGNGTTVSLVNLNTNTIIGTIVVGLAPASLAITPDGKFVYVINYVDGNPGTGTISIIQTSTNTVVGTIPGFSGPFAIAIAPNGRHAYVTNFGSNNFTPIGTTVSVVDLSTNTIIANPQLGIQPSGVDVTPNSKLVYATNYNTLYAGPGFTNLTAGQGTVNIIDAASNIVIPPTIAVGESPSAIAIAPNGEFAYVTNYTYNTVSVIALQSFQITAQAYRLQNRFLTYIEYVNKITLNSTGPSLPVSYAIYRDSTLSDLAGVIPATQAVFLDHNINPTLNYAYYIVGVNRVGTTSNPLAVTVI